MLERVIQQKVLTYCKENSIVAFKVDSTSSRGLPDLVAVMPDGRVYFIELKTATGKLSKLQERFHIILKESNANVAVIRSLTEFKEYVHRTKSRA